MNRIQYRRRAEELQKLLDEERAAHQATKDRLAEAQKPAKEKRK